MISRALVYVAPKSHIFAHILGCFLRYNPSYTPGLAQTDGEVYERVWASLNPAATSVREVGPGSMRDPLDSVCSSHNHQKSCGPGEPCAAIIYTAQDLLVCPARTLRDRLWKALEQARTHAAIFTVFIGAAEERAPEKVAQSSHDIAYFEGDMDPRSDRPCPYKDGESGEWTAALRGAMC